MKIFRINDYLSLRLERDSTGIYVKDRLFSKCKYLMLNVPTYKIQEKEYNFSIDQASERLSSEMEMTEDSHELGLTPEEEFHGHCSNLQAWAESDYNPNLLHSNLAFPLLKKLTDAGDPRAKLVFKNQIVEKFSMGASSVITYMIDEGYFDYFNMNEFEGLLDDLDFSVINIRALIDGIINYYKGKYGQNYISTILEDFIFKLVKRRIFFYFPLIKKIAQEGDNKVRDFFLDAILKRFEQESTKDRDYLISNGYLEYLQEEDKKRLLQECPYPQRQEPKWSHMDRVNCVCFSPDGRFLISSGGPFDRTIKVWNTITWHAFRTLKGHTSDINTICLSPNGRFIVSGSWDKTIRVWKFSTGELITILKGHLSWIKSVTIAPDNDTIASGSGDTRNEDYSVKIWSIQNNTIIKSIKQIYSDVNAVRFTPNGKYLITGAEERRRKDFTIKIWDVESGDLIRNVGDYTNSVLTLDISPNGKIIASGSRDNMIKIWDFSTGELINTLEGHDLHVQSIIFSLDGKFLISGSGDGYVKIWEVESGEIIYTLKGHTLDPLTQNCWINSVAISPKNDMVACGAMDNTINVWNIDLSEIKKKEKKLHF